MIFPRPFAHESGGNLRRAKATIDNFIADDDGGITIMALLLLVAMLIVGGMAVDFMRFESRRALLQSVSDRAVLSAAELDQMIEPEAVVLDYFNKAGLQDTIIGTPTITNSGNSRSVRVDAALDVNTFFLRLIGIDVLRAPAQSVAIEGIGKVEISLVLDISGSMRYGGSSSDGKFGDMQDAAKAFATKVLDPNNGGQVSLNIVPYAGATNPGPQMFGFLDGQRITAVADGASPPDKNRPDPNDVAATSQKSSCLELTRDDWDGSGLPGNGRAQVPYFMNWNIAPDVMDWGWCPHDVSAIRYAMTDAAEAAAFIDGIRMHDGTGTHYAMKYGLALLDPASQPAFAYLNSESASLVPDKFSNRPAPWDDSETKKIIVLMTDGAITDQYRPRFPLAPANAVLSLSSQGQASRESAASRRNNRDDFYAVCNLAKDPSRNIEVYTVAFEVGGSGAEEMRNCASDPSMYFPASGRGLTDVFEDIADQINDLRLSL